MSPLPEHLRKAARSRTEESEKRARAALDQLVKMMQPVSFIAVAREADISTDFLYRHQELRSLIERHRTKTGAVPAQRPDHSEGSSSAAVRALSARLTLQQQEHQREVVRLRKALEVAQGENLALRRRLAQYEAD
ncbi:DUF6262 family protein [Streptomyces sp. NPDC050147]|uniref:DUF6262 family protein n=1 Tax=Streptomyces sp. NPDC050147 TaxID=3155513 RepID=UPI00343D9DC9